MTTLTPRSVLEFADFRLDLSDRCLTRQGVLVPLTPKAFDTLVVLVKRSGHLVTKDELLSEVWPDTFVEEATVVQNIFTVRKALAESGGSTSMIMTVPKRGYRFVAHVTNIDESMMLLETHTRTQVVTEEETSDDSDTDVKRFSVSKKLVASVATLVLAAALVFAVLHLSQQSQPARGTNFGLMALKQVTQSGIAKKTTISAAGEYLAYAVQDTGLSSLRVRHLATGNDIEIVSPAATTYIGITFSPDGNYIYYASYPKGLNFGILNQVPTIGGAPRKILEDIDSPVSISPDGASLAFLRGYPARRETAVVVANLDGTNERKIKPRTFPALYYFEGASWSPDGKEIACGVRGDDGKVVFASLVALNVATGAERLLTSEKWSEIGRVSWLKDGSGLVVSASKQSTQRSQLWVVSSNNGDVRRITNNLHDYYGVSVTADGKSLVAVQTEFSSNIWVGDVGSLKQLPSSRNDGQRGLAWAPDGKLVFISRASGNIDLWVMNADGSQRHAITDDTFQEFGPTVTPDGRYVIYSSAGEGRGPNLWRRHLDGGNLTRLTVGATERFPSSSADSKTLYYSGHTLTTGGAMIETLWKVSVEGGEPKAVTDRASFGARVSPDGKLLALYSEDEPSRPIKIKVVDLQHSKTVFERELEPWVVGLHRWSPEGRALTYALTKDGVSNLWSQGLVGGPPKQLTRFTSDQIFLYEWSKDGKQLALVRGTSTSDVVQIENFR